MAEPKEPSGEGLACTMFGMCTAFLFHCGYSKERLKKMIDGMWMQFQDPRNIEIMKDAATRLAEINKPEEPESS